MEASSLNTKPCMSFEVEKIIGVSSEGNVRSFQIQWAPAWVSGYQLVGCEHLIQEFLDKQSEVVDNVEKCTADELTSSVLGHNSTGNDEKPDEDMKEIRQLTEEPTMSGEERYHDEETSLRDEHTEYLEDPLSDGYDDEAVIKVEEDAELYEGVCTESNTVMTNDEVHSHQHDKHFDTVESSQGSNSFFWNLSTGIPDNVFSPLTHQQSPAEIAPSTKQMSAPPYSDPAIQPARKQHPCESCGRYFPSAAGLRCHMRSHTGDRPFVCEHCGRGFAQKGDLHRHMRTHSGEKPFVCEHCNRGFAQNGDLQRHLITHSREKPFTCEDCGKGFIRKKRWQHHRATIHSVN